MKPLLHTWSLAVEEQFYLVWPALFVGLCVLLKRSWGLILAITALGIVSLTVTEFVLGFDPAQAFYFMPYRGSEFAIGAVLALVEGRGVGSNLVKESACLLGLTMVAAAIVSYSATMRFPGLAALLPCAGAGLIIVGGSAKYVGVLLRNPAALWLGRISYSLYLVHWPILTLYGYWYIHPLDVANRIGIAIVSLLLASIMYVFVEQPFRKSRTANGPVSAIGFFGLASAAVVTLIAASMATLLYDDSWATPSVFNSKTIEAGKSNRFALLLKRCQSPKRDHCDDFVRGKNNVLVVGDSMAVDAYNAMVTIFPDSNIALSGLPGCPPYDDMDHLLNSRWPHRQECIEINRRRFDPSYIGQFDLISINVLFGWYKPEHLERFLSAIRRSSPSAPIVIFGSYMKLTNQCGELVQRRGIRACGEDEFIQSKFLYEDDLKELSDRYAATFISERDAFCRNSQCEYALGAIPFTWDDVHLSLEFAVQLGLRSEKKIRDAMHRGRDSAAFSPAK